MARPYTADEFRAKIALVRSRLDRPAITTDIIVGFPGETDAEFEETVALAKDVAFARMHIFAFSARKGTAAAKMRPRIPASVIKTRSQALRDLDRDLQSRFRAQFLGETASVLIEDTKGPRPAGLAERYFAVEIGHGTDETYGTDETDRTHLHGGKSHEPYPSDRSHQSCSAGDIVAVRLERNGRDAVLGRIA